MLSVIVDAQGAEDRLAGLFAALTPAAVEGLVREVLVAGAAKTELGAEAVEAICKDMGAEEVGDLPAAVAQSKSDWVLVLPAAIRFRDGWVERLRDHLAAGPADALVRGQREGGLFAKRPAGVLTRRETASGLAGLDALLRKLDRRARRLD
ncbi:cell wall biosynthesis glycosyltransferase [Phenylobacterium sp.]|jgi:uncharacterized protein YbaA (DUF1428 family)|uniref:cell wall biosynthesis glycosyltransferase n=1 Tax=Phenylobacterium sp. TaxID=1871053 RepID=UPI002F953561